MNQKQSEKSPVKQIQMQRIDLSQRQKYYSLNSHNTSPSKGNEHNPRNIQLVKNLVEHNLNHQTNKLSFSKVFQPFKIPPDIQQCQFHRVATQFGKPIERNRSSYEALKQNSSNNQTQRGLNQPQTHLIPKLDKLVCPCCGQQPKQQLPVCCRVQEIYNVNESLGFYFTYIKTMGVMLFLIAITVGAYALKQIITDCNQQQTCVHIYGIPVSKFSVFFNQLLIILNIVILVIMYFFTIYLYYQNAHNHRKIFLNHKKPSDYCVFISGVDHEKVTGQDLINYFNKFQIVDILYTHKIEKYVKKLALKSIFTAKKNLYYRQGKDKQVQKLDLKIDDINNYLLHIKNRLNLKQQKSVRTDKIFIKFKTPQQKYRFQRNYKENIYETILRSFCGASLIEINGNKMYVQPLGEPHEIVWENLEVKSTQRYLRVFMGNVLTLIVLGCSYMLVALFAKLEKAHNGTKDILLSIGFSIVVEITNFILDLIIQQLTEWQRRYTLTGKIGVILIKNFVSFFLNTTLIPFSLFIFAWGAPNQDDLVRNIFTLFVISNFVSPFISLYVRPKALFVWYMKRTIKKEGKDCVETQVKANEYFEKNDFDLNARYSLILEIVTNSIFYAAVFPIGLIVTFFGLILAYWTSKWWLIKYCSIPKYSYRLGRLATNISTVFPCIFAFGYALNLVMTSNNQQLSTLVPFIIGIVTIPITILLLLFGNRAAQSFVASQYRSVKENLNLDDSVRTGHSNRHIPDYRELNPTTFIHSNIHKEIQQSEFYNIMERLEQYAFNKETRYLRRDSALMQSEEQQENQ